jgi:uncharacterized protein (DUF1330 family)
MSGHAFTLVVLLWLHADRGAEFEEFERAASEIMRRYGGRIQRRMVMTGSSADDDQPDEIHVVTFPDELTFDAYRRDPGLVSLLGVRELAISRTTLWQAEFVPPWSGEEEFLPRFGRDE